MLMVMIMQNGVGGGLPPGGWGGLAPEYLSSLFTVPGGPASSLRAWAEV